MQLDVHILVMDYTPREVVTRCLQSVERAALAAPFPVNIYPVEGLYGHLGKSRARGYSLGAGNYVTHVDDDDWVEDRAFAVLPLQEGRQSVTTGENQYFSPENINPLPLSRHHLAVYKRDWLEMQRFEDFVFYPDQYLLSKVSPVHVSDCVYNHVMSATSGSRRHRGANDEAQKAELRAIRSPELFQADAMSYADIARLIDKEMDQ